MMNWLAHWMGTSQGKPEPPPTPTPTPSSTASPYVNPLNPEGLRPCCACLETKSARDQCFMKSEPWEADAKCREQVMAHLACMRGYGFKV